jgi:hypothetical protein
MDTHDAPAPFEFPSFPCTACAAVYPPRAARPVPRARSTRQQPVHQAFLHGECVPTAPVRRTLVRARRQCRHARTHAALTCARVRAQARAPPLLAPASRPLRLPLRSCARLCARPMRECTTYARAVPAHPRAPPALAGAQCRLVRIFPRARALGSGPRHLASCSVIDLVALLT